MDKGALLDLLQNGHSSFHRAAENGHMDMLQVMLHPKYGVNVDLLDTNQVTPLLLAKHSSILALLLEKGADINRKDSNGRTPLHLSVLRNDVRSVDLLVKCGANTEEVDSDGHSPLHYAKNMPRGVRNTVLIHILEMDEELL